MTKKYILGGEKNLFGIFEIDMLLFILILK